MNEKYMSYAIKVELVFGLYFYSYISTLVNWPSRDTSHYWLLQDDYGPIIFKNKININIQSD